jgi:RNA polymerase sigma factor (TIGR02999 family)
MSLKKESLDREAAVASHPKMQAVYDGFGAIYPQLRALASAMMSRERVSHTLQPTAVVSEAFLRIADRQGSEFQSQSHLLAYAATAMRSILVDHARRRRSKKRGSGAKVGSDMIAELAADPKVGVDLLEIDDALRALEGADPRASKVVEARIFGGLSIEEAAEALGLSLSTVSRDWRFGRAFLAGQLSQDGAPPTADEEAAS